MRTATAGLCTFRLWWKVLTVLFVWAFFLALTTSPNMAQQGVGGVITNPTVPLELPVEVETELSPAGSLKQSPLWQEVARLLDNPYLYTCTDPSNPETCVSGIQRRPGFGAVMPPLNVWPPCFNVLTGQPLRTRVSDGEISWDQPGPLFDPDEEIEVDANNVPLEQRTVIGHLVVNDENELVVSNPSGHPAIPPDGTEVAEPACNEDGQIVEDGELVEDFEKPISELDILRPTDDTAMGGLFPNGIPASLQPYVGRQAAVVLGKALFWDMQVGSDGVQACGTCHFHAGGDNRTKNQLNPNHLGGNLTLEVHTGPNQDLVASDYPFRRLMDIDGPSESLGAGGTIESNHARDSNDVMSSMGVRFRKFSDVPVGTGAFFSGPAGPTTVRVLRPDIPVRQNELDPIPVFQGFRRVEPRNTPTIFSAAFNFDNFWDGRARHDSNGGSVFGPSDPQFHVFVDPGAANGSGANGLQGATNGYFRPDMLDQAEEEFNPEVAEQPVRIRFSSLASLATGPALSDFEMSFQGRNWPKLGKKLLQGAVTPLANQLVATDDSAMGPFSNQPHAGSLCGALPAGARSSMGVVANKPGLCISYTALIQLAFGRDLWHNTNRHFNGASAACTSAVNGVLTPAGCDPFDSYVLSNPVANAASPTDTNQFRQIEANFSLFFGQSLQAWQMVLIPDDSPFDQFMDANPLAGNGVGQPGEQGVLHPSEIPGLVGPLTLVPGFGQDELFGFDIFAGANLTAALPVGSARNPAGHGSNPFMRTGRCMICHLGPEQTDHTNNVNAGLLLSNTEFEFPTPQSAPEPTGPFRVVTGIGLAEEVAENAQDGVEVENRNFAMNDDPATPWDDRQIGVPNGIAFQDNGVYNIGVRPTNEDIMRGGNDAFGWPLSLGALALKNLAGRNFEPCDTPTDPGTLSSNEPPVFLGGPCTSAMANFDSGQGPGGGLFEETGADQLVNPGLQMEPALPMLPPYLAPWANNLPAGELHPQIDELAFAPNTITYPPPVAEFGEVLFGADLHCIWDGVGWGPLCPTPQSGVPNNFGGPLNGTSPFPNRVGRNGAVKAPQLRNVELTGPYFHTGSYLTLRQVIDFYMRGGDFPLTNAEDRDPNLVNVFEQAFGFGTTIGLPPQFQDGVPDVITQYGPMPDTTHEGTPEYATPEDAISSLVKLLLSFTDARVKFERAPFDHPEIFVPLDGVAPDNAALAGPVAGGRQGFVNNLAGVCAGGTGPCFRQVPAVGALGSPAPLAPFLDLSNTPVGGPNNDHFDR